MERQKQQYISFKSSEGLQLRYMGGNVYYQTNHGFWRNLRKPTNNDMERINRAIAIKDKIK